MPDEAALQDFVRTHISAEPAQLLLKYGKSKTTFDLKDAVLRIAALQKLRTKAPSWYLEQLRFPHLLAVEQASSEATARYKSRIIGSGRVLDLSGGLGIDSWAFAQGGATVTYVEKQTMMAGCARSNFMALGVQHRIEVLAQTAEEYLAELPNKRFDWIYVDPDRRQGSKRVVDFSACSPDVAALLPQLFTLANRVLIKASPMLDIQSGIQQLGQVERVEVVGWQGECKEVLFVCNKDYSYSKPKVRAVELDADGEQICAIEQAPDTPLRLSEPLTYLYDPPASVLKAACFAEFGHVFGLFKLHASTHLYTSADLVEVPVGRVLQVVAVCNARREDVLQYLPKAQANLRSVNFPQTTEVLKKQLGLKDGGDHTVFAVTLADHSRKLLICTNVTYATRKI